MLIKKILLILLVLFCGQQGMQVQAENIEKSVKDGYSEIEETPKKTDAPAEGKTTEVSDESGNIGITFWDIVRTIAALIFVIVLLYLLLQFVNKKSKAYQKANTVENLGGTSLGSNRSVQIIKVGQRILVVGVGENIQLLKEIDDKGEYEQILNDHNQKIDQLIRPADILSKWRDKLKGEGSSSKSFAPQFKKQVLELTKERKKALGVLNKKGRNMDE
ncbi:flagellar biosynthetic protein FliO [Peribacillus psychrosaccharolyticus]|nr:flagellar biosynthetic protein FliO [Peribacillus psychrosaccharolyticus]MEC2053816.1 flagellar biosynthetic protein FliO [Peribacillus psychrosaccharolyticus]MED3742570.1 flagellar biosynthetic protein FliO [Peribacillus psychrosaccharolyticus]